MKIAATFLAAAALVSAAPIRVVVVTNANGATGKVNFESLTAVRFGHAAAGAQGIPEPAFAMSEPIRMIRPGQPGHPTLRLKHHCKGGLRDKAVAIWNSFTGFISHKVSPHRPIGDEIDPDKLAIYTSPGILSPHLREKLRADAARLNGGATTAAHPPVSPPFIKVSRPHQAPIHDEPFMYRLSRALSMLGPWEGRAMAFVFGCGLGVLIRMIHVMVLLLVRSRRCKKERAVTLGTEEEQAPLYVAPPEYVIFDEKEADAVPAEVVVVVETVQQK